MPGSGAIAGFAFTGFGAGTCGDINHIDVKTKGRRTAKEIGSLLADTVLSKFPALEPVEIRTAAKVYRASAMPGATRPLRLHRSRKCVVVGFRM